MDRGTWWATVHGATWPGPRSGCGTSPRSAGCWDLWTSGPFRAHSGLQEIPIATQKDSGVLFFPSSETVPDSLPATPKSPPTRRVPPRGILCRPLLLLPSAFPSIMVFSKEPVLGIRWPKYWSLSFSISPSNEHPGLISFVGNGNPLQCSCLENPRGGEAWWAAVSGVAHFGRRRKKKRPGKNMGCPAAPQRAAHLS